MQQQKIKIGHKTSKTTQHFSHNFWVMKSNSVRIYYLGLAERRFKTTKSF